ncbi:NHLP bacteriocin system secretion protein [Legionella gresilensis]|uniref:NHLP bacteriocin system secretion protein n=1 Tax=Legionella gresilensis TaxID=91823 RepID=UPI0010411E44|nr:NHLP bacteriocin system secretion protein [Legionella gresilensis]
MAKKKGIVFRKKALEQINRPTLNEDVIQVITPKYWLLFFVFFLIIGVFFIWLIKGTLFIRVEGKGVLMAVSSDVVTVQAPTVDGKIKDVYIKPGDQISKGSKLVSYTNEVTLELNTSQQFLTKLQAEQKNLNARSKQIVSTLEQNQNDQIIKINDSLNAARQKLKQLQIMLDLKEKALKKGIIDLPNVTETRVEYYRLLQEINSHEADLISQKANLIELKDKWLERERELALNVLKAEEQVALLKQKLQESQVITSPVNGIVAEVRVRPGDYTKAGEALLSIIPKVLDLYALVFVPARKGKLLKPGMSAQITPTIINKLEYGTIKGHVQSISLLPVTQESMMAVLKNQQLVSSFLSQEPLMSVKILMNRDVHTPSGFQWTSRLGPNIQLTQGTLIEVMINIETKRPIDLLINFYN